MKCSLCVCILNQMSNVICTIQRSVIFCIPLDVGTTSCTVFCYQCSCMLFFACCHTGPEPQPLQQPVDDFIIGNRVWVGGTKPGYIAFLGETQFAPGEWAGVVLDEPVGKNDGSVSGVRYFQCEPKRGVFARISKLSRTEGGASAPTPRPEGQSNGTKTPPGNLAPRSVTPKLGLAVSRTSSGSTSSLNKGVTGSASANMGSGPRSGFKAGDRVMVSGTKPGTLRYVGETDFAKGVWAGVELDDPMGKNDGAVAGKR